MQHVSVSLVLVVHPAVFAVPISCTMAVLRPHASFWGVCLQEIALMLHRLLAGEAQKPLQQLQLSVLLTAPRQIY